MIFGCDGALEPPLYIRDFHLVRGVALRIVFAPFEVARFQISSFAKAGIACPPTVAQGVRKRQAEFFYGRLAARGALREYGAPEVDIQIGLAREPIWPEGVVGSISHTDGLAAAVVGARARHLGLGIDIESTVSPGSEQVVRALVFNACELEYLETMSGVMRMRELVTLGFSAKESFYKGVFGIVGRIFDFDAVRISVIDVENALVELTVEQNLHPLFTRGRRCVVGYQRLNAGTFLTVFEAF